MQARQLTLADPDYKRLTTGTLTIAGWRGWFLRQRVTDEGEPMEEVVVAVEMDGVGILATGSDLDWIERMLPALIAAL